MNYLCTTSYFVFRKILAFSFITMANVKQFLCMPEQALWLQEVEALRISREFAHEGGKLLSPRHRPPLPSRR
jgi:hypothetical protein